MRKWLLPEAIEDVLPVEAARVEALRRALLDHFAAHGYRLVSPPLIEHLDSLLTGTGRDLDLQTFKMVDPLSGRMLGLRADTTPQVARIDAHLLNETGVTRLCYAGSVLRTAPAGPAYTREVVQIGGELYGHAGIAADREVMRLLLSALERAGARGCTSTSATSASIARWRTPRGSTPPARATTANCSSRCATRTFRRCASSRRACRTRTRCAARAGRACMAGSRNNRAARRALPDLPEVAEALDEALARRRGGRGRCDPRRPGGPARLSLLHWRDVFRVRDRRGWHGGRLRPRRPLRRRRHARSAAPGRRPASRWTCAGWRRWRRRRRARRDRRPAIRTRHWPSTCELLRRAANRRRCLPGRDRGRAGPRELRA